MKYYLHTFTYVYIYVLSYRNPVIIPIAVILVRSRSSKKHGTYGTSRRENRNLLSYLIFLIFLIFLTFLTLLDFTFLFYTRAPWHPLVPRVSHRLNQPFLLPLHRLISSQIHSRLVFDQFGQISTFISFSFPWPQKPQKPPKPRSGPFGRRAPILRAPENPGLDSRHQRDTCSSLVPLNTYPCLPLSLPLHFTSNQTKPSRNQNEPNQTKPVQED